MHHHHADTDDDSSEDPAEWGFEDEDGVDFKKRYEHTSDATQRARREERNGSRHTQQYERLSNRLSRMCCVCACVRVFVSLLFLCSIADLTHHAHGSAPNDSLAALNFSDDEFGDDDDGDAAWDIGDTDWRVRTRQFSTAVWDWQEKEELAEAAANANEADAKTARGSLDGKHSASASLVSTASLAGSDASRWSSLSSVASVAVSAQIAASSAATGASAAAPSAAAAAAVPTSTPPQHPHTHARAVHHGRTSHHPHHSHGSAGTGRNLSLDSSARALGLNIAFVERLGLPFLRNEIHSFFAKLTSRADSLLVALEAAPAEVLRRMLRGMHDNAAATSDEELTRSFEASAKRMQQQIDEVEAADPGADGDSTPNAAAVLTPSTSPPSMSPLSSPPSAAAVAAATAACFSPSPPRPSAGSHPSATYAFVMPAWWPASLAASHTSLTRIREVFAAMAGGFDDAASTTSFAAIGPSIARFTASGSPPARSASLPTSSPSRAPPVPKLQALPTTHSNRDGLKLLARLLQSFSMLIAFEGGQIAQASKLALAFQRMANTLLEKHKLEEKQWSKS